MKTTLNAKELKELDACEEGYNKFVSAHGDKTVTLSEAFESNGWYDIWWYINKVGESFLDQQNKDFRLLAADYAERVLHMFEYWYPEDQRPRLAIKAARDFANGRISKQELRAARDAARVARAAAGDAAWAAARAARDAARAAEQKWQEEKLMELFKKWSEQKGDL